MIPRQAKPKIVKYSSLTNHAFDDNVKENDIVEIDDYRDWIEYNSANEKIECYKIRGKDGDDYLVSKAFQGQIPFCDAIQYTATPTASLFLGDYLVDSYTGEASDIGYAWVPIVKRFADERRKAGKRTA